MGDLIDRETGEILAPPEDSAVIAFACYMQEAARQEHWVKHNHLTKPWKASIKERMAESGGLSAWKRAIKLASESDWLCGRIIGKKSETRFRMTLKFMLQPVSFVSILDGFYNNRTPEPSRLTLPTMQPPHLKPQPAFVPEPLPVRLAAMIVSYRRHNKYADANRIEEQLAALEKRPPALVPAPDWQSPPSPQKPSRQPAQGVSEPEWEMVPE